MNRLTSLAILTLNLFPTLARAGADADHPKLTLDNAKGSIDLYLPDAQRGFYRGLRYDHAGMVAQARFAGHTFFGELIKPHDPLVHDHGAGTVEEFGMTLTPPLGFAEAKAGEAFLKIGVGLLQKDKDRAAYSFAGAYKVVELPAWKVEPERAVVTFTQSAGLPNGLAYRYTKRVELTDDGFRIVRKLENTGKAKWSTDHYGHNYISIDDRPIDSQYKLELPFALTLAEQNGTKAAVVTGKQIGANRALGEKEALWAHATGHGESAKDNVMVMRVDHAGAKAGVEITTDFPVRRLVLYATQRAFCPEAFVEFTLEPGQSQTWMTTYRFYTTP
jgi:hypothetical protein